MNLKDQGYKLVLGKRGVQWVHPSEVTSTDVDCTDMTDDEFDAFIAGKFAFVQRTFGSCVASATLPVWVVEYERTSVRARYFQAYIAVEGSAPGTVSCQGAVNNKRIGHADHGFETLGRAVLSAYQKAISEVTA